MNRYKLSKVGINANEGIARFGGNAETYEKLLKEFLSDRNFEELSGAVGRGDVKAAFAFAHALKGVSGNLSMKRLYEDLLPLVEELRNDRLDNADDLLCIVKRDYEEIIAVLE